jgi:dsRNA-specific ribonuclease
MSDIQLKNLYDTVFNYPVIRDISADLLLLAITPPSKNKINNDRLEFLGDAVLELAISDMLYKHF